MADSVAACGRLEEAEALSSRAIEILDQVATDYPGFPFYRECQAEAHRGRADLLTNPLDAENAYRRAVNLRAKLATDFPTKGDYWQALAQDQVGWARFQSAAGKTKEAEELVHQAIESYGKVTTKSPNLVALAHYALARILGEGKRPEEAIKEYGLAVAAWEKLAADFPNESVYRLQLAWGYAGSGRSLSDSRRPDEAVKALKKAVSLFKKLGDDFPARGDYRKWQSWSETWLIEALEAQASRIENDVTLAERDRQDKAQACRTEARRLVQEGLKQGLQTPLWLNNTAWRLATDADPSNRDGYKAVEFAKLATEREPKQGKFWTTLGAARYRANDWKAAIEALNKSMELRNGGDSLDWFFLAMAHWQLGEKEIARTWFDKAAAWMDKHQAQNEELHRFRREAAELLAVKEEKK